MNEDFGFLERIYLPSNILKLLLLLRLDGVFPTVATLAPTDQPCVAEVTYLERG